jgi:p-cumate 2,3-dioxygenase beta subunit
VPSTDLPPGADPAKSLFYIADDRMRLEQRVARLLKKTAHSE